MNTRAREITIDTITVVSGVAPIRNAKYAIGIFIAIITDDIIWHFFILPVAATETITPLLILSTNPLIKARTIKVLCVQEPLSTIALKCNHRSVLMVT